MEDADRARWAQAYQAGASLVELAEQADCSPSTMRTELIRAGVTMRPPGRQRARTGGGT